MYHCKNIVAGLVLVCGDLRSVFSKAVFCTKVSITDINIYQALKTKSAG